MLRVLPRCRLFNLCILVIKFAEQQIERSRQNTQSKNMKRGQTSSFFGAHSKCQLKYGAFPDIYSHATCQEVAQMLQERGKYLKVQLNYKSWEKIVNGLTWLFVIFRIIPQYFTLYYWAHKKWHEVREKECEDTRKWFLQSGVDGFGAKQKRTLGCWLFSVPAWSHWGSCVLSSTSIRNRVWKIMSLPER